MSIQKLKLELYSNRINNYIDGVTIIYEKIINELKNILLIIKDDLINYGVKKIVIKTRYYNLIYKKMYLEKKESQDICNYEFNKDIEKFLDLFDDLIEKYSYILFSYSKIKKYNDILIFSV